MPAAMIERRAISERFPPSRFPGVGMIGWAVAFARNRQRLACAVLGIRSARDLQESR